MARQGNYVSVPSGNANWAKDISGSLTDLSKNLLAQGAAEDELERQKLLDAENQRRYETELGFKQRAETIAEEERNRALQERKALTDFATGYSSDAARENAFTESPEMQKGLDEYLTKSRDLLARNAYIEATRNQMGGQGAEFGVNLGLTEENVPEDIADRLDAAIASGQSSPMLTAYQESLKDLESNARQHVLSNMPVYREAEAARINRNLLSQGVDPTKALQTSQLLASQYSSEKDFTDRAKEAQKQRQKYYDDKADITYKAIKLAKEGKSSNGYYVKPGPLDEKTVGDKIEDFDAGPKDSVTLRNMYDAGVEAGVSPTIVMKALEESISDTTGYFFRTRGPKLSEEDFVMYAKAREASNTKDGDSLSREDIIKAITPERAEYIDPREANRLAVLGELSQFAPKRDALPMVLPESNTTVVEKPYELVGPSTVVNGVDRRDYYKRRADYLDRVNERKNYRLDGNFYDGVGPKGMYDALSEEAKKLEKPYRSIMDSFIPVRAIRDLLD